MYFEIESMIFFLISESRRLGKTVMFINQYGPMVFSSTDSEEEEETSNNSDANDDLNEDIKPETLNQLGEFERPLKKIKLSP